jgi:plastocyanin
VSNVNVSAGEIVTCTFTNVRKGRIIAVKDSLPDDPQDFDFTAGGGLSPSSFQLDDDSDGTLSNTRTFDDVAPGSGYSVSESVPTGWDQTAATCDDGSPVSNIDVSAGETVTCTFTNRKRGEIVVVKDAQPNGPQDFDFTAGGGLSPSSFQLDDDADGTLSNARTFSNVVPGSGYTVSETLPTGWEQTGATCDDGSPLSNIDVSAGETVTCTFTNQPSGTIVVVKDSLPDDPQDFDFTAGGGLSPSSFQLDDDSDGTLSNSRTIDSILPGSGYSVSESVPTGWDQTSATCDDGSPVSNIDVSAGETVTCTFTNAKRGQIVVVKDAQPNDPQDFDFTAGGGLSPSSFQLDDDSDGTLPNTQTFPDVPPGSGYSVSETAINGWFQAQATCNDGSPPSNISVSPGETVTCTFNNVSGYPRPKGATPTRVALVPAYAECTSPNRVHGPSLASGSCAPPTQTSSYLTVGTVDANLKPSNLTGSVKFRVIPGNAGTPADEADVDFLIGISDIRNQGSLTDYTGEIVVNVPLRITDRLNGPSEAETGTVDDFTMTVPIGCAATVDTNIGSNCNLVTTADALTPGTIREVKRTIWQLGRIDVYDGGPDGLAATTGGNTLFLRQGLFVP